MEANDRNISTRKRRYSRGTPLKDSSVANERKISIWGTLSQKDEVVTAKKKSSLDAPPRDHVVNTETMLKSYLPQKDHSETTDQKVNQDTLRKDDSVAERISQNDFTDQTTELRPNVVRKVSKITTVSSKAAGSVQIEDPYLSPTRATRSVNLTNTAHTTSKSDCMQTSNPDSRLSPTRIKKSVAGTDARDKGAYADPPVCAMGKLENTTQQLPKKRQQNNEENQGSKEAAKENGRFHGEQLSPEENVHTIYTERQDFSEAERQNSASLVEERRYFNNKVTSTSSEKACNDKKLEDGNGTSVLMKEGKDHRTCRNLSSAEATSPFPEDNILETREDDRSRVLKSMENVDQVREIGGPKEEALDTNKETGEQKEISLEKECREIVESKQTNWEQKEHVNGNNKAESEAFGNGITTGGSGRENSDSSLKVNVDTTHRVNTAIALDQRNQVSEADVLATRRVHAAVSPQFSTTHRSSQAMISHPDHPVDQLHQVNSDRAHHTGCDPTHTTDMESFYQVNLETNKQAKTHEAHYKKTDVTQLMHPVTAGQMNTDPNQRVHKDPFYQINAQPGQLMHADQAHQMSVDPTHHVGTNPNVQVNTNPNRPVNFDLKDGLAPGLIHLMNTDPHHKSHSVYQKRTDSTEQTNLKPEFQENANTVCQITTASAQQTSSDPAFQIKAEFDDQMIPCPSHLMNADLQEGRDPHPYQQATTGLAHKTNTDSSHLVTSVQIHDVNTGQQVIAEETRVPLAENESTTQLPGKTNLTALPVNSVCELDMSDGNNRTDASREDPGNQPQLYYVVDNGKGGYRVLQADGTEVIDYDESGYRVLQADGTVEEFEEDTRFRVLAAGEAESMNSEEDVGEYGALQAVSTEVSDPGAENHPSVSTGGIPNAAPVTETRSSNLQDIERKTTVQMVTQPMTKHESDKESNNNRSQAEIHTKTDSTAGFQTNPPVIIPIKAIPAMNLQSKSSSGTAADTTKHTTTTAIPYIPPDTTMLYQPEEGVLKSKPVPKPSRGRRGRRSKLSVEAAGFAPYRTTATRVAVPLAPVQQHVPIQGPSGGLPAALLHAAPPRRSKRAYRRYTLPLPSAFPPAHCYSPAGPPAGATASGAVGEGELLDGGGGTYPGAAGDMLDSHKVPVAAAIPRYGWHWGDDCVTTQQQWYAERGRGRSGRGRGWRGSGGVRQYLQHRLLWARYTGRSQEALDRVLSVINSRCSMKGDNLDQVSSKTRSRESVEDAVEQMQLPASGRGSRGDLHDPYEVYHNRAFSSNIKNMMTGGINSGNFVSQSGIESNAVVDGNGYIVYLSQEDSTDFQMPTIPYIPTESNLSSDSNPARLNAPPSPPENHKEALKLQAQGSEGNQQSVTGQKAQGSEINQHAAKPRKVQGSEGKKGGKRSSAQGGEAGNLRKKVRRSLTFSSPIKQEETLTATESIANDLNNSSEAQDGSARSTREDQISAASLPSISSLLHSASNTGNNINIHLPNDSDIKTEQDGKGEEAKDRGCYSMESAASKGTVGGESGMRRGKASHSPAPRYTVEWHGNHQEIGYGEWPLQQRQQHHDLGYSEWSAQQYYRLHDMPGDWPHQRYHLDPSYGEWSQRYLSEPGYGEWPPQQRLYLQDPGYVGEEWSQQRFGLQDSTYGDWMPQHHQHDPQPPLPASHRNLYCGDPNSGRSFYNMDRPYHHLSSCYPPDYLKDRPALFKRHLEHPTMPKHDSAGRALPTGHPWWGRSSEDYADPCHESPGDVSKADQPCYGDPHMSRFPVTRDFPHSAHQGTQPQLEDAAVSYSEGTLLQAKMDFASEGILSQGEDPGQNAADSGCERRQMDVDHDSDSRQTGIGSGCKVEGNDCRQSADNNKDCRKADTGGEYRKADDGCRQIGNDIDCMRGDGVIYSKGINVSSL